MLLVVPKKQLIYHLLLRRQLV